MTKYPLDQSQPVDFKHVSKFVSDFVAGKIAPSVKSQKIPSSQDEPVYVLVADEFSKVVNDSNKDVFVEFYAPWCGHCKKLKPTWDELGERYALAKDKVVIAKFDATENDVPSEAGFRVTGFPTLKFKAAGSDEWLSYEGDRSLESLIDFVESNATNDLTAVDDLPEGAEEELLEGQTVFQTPDHHDEL